jgi:drug/metabolite transporter (DMT)-like permease
MHEARPFWTVWVALGFLWLAWGYNFLVIKITLPYVGPFQFALLRTWLSFAALALWLAYLGRLRWPSQNGGLLAILGLLQTGGFTGFTYLALVSGGTGKTALLAFTNPLWATLVAWYVLAERPRRSQLIAIGIAVVGILLIVQWWSGTSSVQSNLFALGAGISLGGSSVVIKKLQERGEEDLIHITAWQMLLGSLPLLIGVMLFLERPLVANWVFAFGLAYNVFTTAVGWPLWAYVLKKMPAGVANMNTLAIPIIGLFTGWWYLREKWSNSDGVGIALVLISLIIIWMAPLANRVFGERKLLDK